MLVPQRVEGRAHGSVTGRATSKRDLDVSLGCPSERASRYRAPPVTVQLCPRRCQKPAARAGSRVVIGDPCVLLALEGFLLEAGGCTAVCKNRATPEGPPIPAPVRSRPVRGPPANVPQLALPARPLGLTAARRHPGPPARHLLWGGRVHAPTDGAASRSTYQVPRPEDASRPLPHDSAPAPSVLRARVARPLVKPGDDLVCVWASPPPKRRRRWRSQPGLWP